MANERTSPRFPWLILAAALSGGGFALCMPGPDWSLLAFVCLVPWGLASLTASRRSWPVDWIFYVSMLSFSTYWIGYVSVVGAVLAIGVESALMLPLGWLFRRLNGRMPAAFALPLAWCAVEFLRTRYPYGGVPFAILGFSQYQSPLLIQVADLLGVTGVSFVLASVNGFFIDWVYRGKVTFGSAAAWALVVAALVYGRIAPELLERRGSGPIVLCVQANIPAESKGEPMAPDAVFRAHLEKTAQALAQARAEGQLPDLLVWSEGMFPWALGEAGPEAVFLEGPPRYTGAEAIEAERILTEHARRLLPEGRTFFLPGLAYGMEHEGRYRFHNSALLFSPEGRRAGLYHKIHLVPGGEFVPQLGPISWLAERLSDLEGFRGQLGAIVPGERVEVFSIATERGSWKLAPSICYDNAYSDLYREAAAKGADFHLVLSNEGWYGLSNEFEQLLAAATFRSVETRRATVRATNSGISAWIGPEGRIEKVVQERGRAKQVGGFLLAELPLCEDRSLFVIWGDGPWWILTAVACFLALFPWKMGNPAGPRH